jgi:hypothetical protein
MLRTDFVTIQIISFYLQQLLIQNDIHTNYVIATVFKDNKDYCLPE